MLSASTSESHELQDIRRYSKDVSVEGDVIKNVVHDPKQKKTMIGLGSGLRSS